MFESHPSSLEKDNMTSLDPSENYQEYIGIADDLGIDTLMPWKEADAHRQKFIELRAQLNGQRNAMVFKAIMAEKDYEEIQAYANSKLALIKLKKVAIWIGAVNKSQQSNWDSIPKYSYNEINPPYPKEKDEEEAEQLELDL